MRYLAAPSSSIYYVGWLGYENLGDEVVLQATAECLDPVPLAPASDSSYRILQHAFAMKRHSLALLGGGTQIGARSPIESFRLGLSRSRTAAVFGAGVSPSTDGPVPEWLKDWGNLLSDCSYVGVRGTESARTLARVGIKAEALGDTAIWFSQPSECWIPKERVLGLNVGQAHGQMYGQEAEIQSILADFARVMSQRGWEIEFFCVWPEDLSVAKGVAAAAGLSQPIIHEFYSKAEPFLAAAQKMTLFVGIKLHSVVLAMCANVPSLMIEYRPKCREFMESVGMEHHTIRSDEITVEILIAAVEELKQHGPDISRQIRARMMPIQARIGVVGRELVRLASALPDR